MKVIFMGTPDFAVPVLEALHRHHEVICVYTQPARPSGKGYKLISTPVCQKAEELGIPVRTPLSLKKPDAIQELKDLNADVAVVCAYGLILPQAVLDAPKKGCINVHASLLPRWRGAAPIQRAIEAGDKKSGVTIMQMDAGLDTGDMLLKGEVPITAHTNAEELHDALCDLGAKLIIEALEKNPQPIAQPQEGVTYAAKIQKSEAQIDWHKRADQVLCQIMAFNPYPGAYFVYKNERIKVFDAEVENTSQENIPGTVLDDAFLIACAENTAIRLKVLQREGKKKMDVADFIKGFNLPKGENIAL